MAGAPTGKSSGRPLQLSCYLIALTCCDSTAIVTVLILAAHIVVVVTVGLVRIASEALGVITTLDMASTVAFTNHPVRVRAIAVGGTVDHPFSIAMKPRAAITRAANKVGRTPRLRGDAEPRYHRPDSNQYKQRCSRSNQLFHNKFSFPGQLVHNAK